MRVQFPVIVKAIAHVERTVHAMIAIMRVARMSHETTGTRRAIAAADAARGLTRDAEVVMESVGRTRNTALALPGMVAARRDGKIRTRPLFFEALTVAGENLDNAAHGIRPVQRRLGTASHLA